LWNITKDAKDGDVLATDDGNICVFDGTVEDDKYPFAYYGLVRRRFESYDRRLPFTHDNVHPATKEQRDTLLKAMTDAGYEWDAEQKQLKKIEHNTAWSEEDEDLLKWTINNLTELEQRFGKDYGKVGECINWIKQRRWKKSLKTADLENSLCDIQDGYNDTSYEYRVLGEAIEFIRSTDPWKPSEEQLSALHDAAIHIKDSMFPYPKDILMDLYEQLKSQNHEI
jgi:hypothetical protein